MFTEKLAKVFKAHLRVFVAFLTYLLIFQILEEKLATTRQVSKKNNTYKFMKKLTNSLNFKQ
jgi:hypothetical protein